MTDVQQSEDELTTAGASILTQPVPFSANGSSATVGLAKDPDGYTLELITPQ